MHRLFKSVLPFVRGCWKFTQVHNQVSLSSIIFFSEKIIGKRNESETEIRVMWNAAMAQTGPLLSRVLSDFHWRSSATQVSPKNTQTGIPPRLISPAHRPPPPPPQQRRSGGGLDWGKGQKGKREVSSAAWIRGWKKTCCWGKQFRRVYQQLLWEIAVSGAHVKPLAGGSFGGAEQQQVAWEITD